MNMGREFHGLVTITKFSTRKILLSRKAVLAVLIMLFIGAVMGYAATQDVERLDGGTDLMDSLILFFFMPVVSMIYGSSLIRDGINDKSITHLLTSPIDRVTAYLGYYISLVLSVSIIMVLITTVGFLSFYIPQGVDSTAVGIYLKVSSLVVIGSVVYSSLFLMVSIILERPIYFGLFFAFIWEGFVGSLPGRIRTVAIKHYIRSMGSKWIKYGGISNYDATKIGDSTVVLAGLTLTLIVFGSVLFKMKEFP